jgi:hypothetical protein
MPDIAELKAVLQERAGLDEAQAARAAEVALNFLTERVPQLSGLLDTAGGAESLASRIGGLFGKKD